MACSTCGGKSPQVADSQVFTVTYPSGATKDVIGEHAAKVEQVKNPGATYTRK